MGSGDSPRKLVNVLDTVNESWTLRNIPQSYTSAPIERIRRRFIFLRTKYSIFFSHQTNSGEPPANRSQLQNKPSEPTDKMSSDEQTIREDIYDKIHASERTPLAVKSICDAAKQFAGGQKAWLQRVLDTSNYDHVMVTFEEFRRCRRGRRALGGMGTTVSNRDSFDKPTCVTTFSWELLSR